MDSQQDLTRALRKTQGGVVGGVAGAGMSFACGSAAFRGDGADAVWERDVTELGTLRYFLEDPVGSWSWYLSRFDKVLDAAPNPAHDALVSLERWWTQQGGDFLLVTQNVDPLHEMAGSKALVKVHGSAHKVRCVRDGCVHGSPRGSLDREIYAEELRKFVDEPQMAHLPVCPDCGSFLRQHVLWFDEYYNGHDDYQYERTQMGAQSMDLLLCRGTSFSVGVTELFRNAASWKGIPAFSVDPSGRAPSPFVNLREKAELLLPSIVENLAE